MSLEFSKRVERVAPYPAAAGYGYDGPLTKLASNESPEPPLKSVVAAATSALNSLNRYPDPTNAKLRAALSARYEVPAKRIAVGNGSCDILLAAGEALLEPGAELIYAWPSFSVYPHLAAASGATEVIVPLDQNDCHDLSAMAKEVTAATRLLIVANPNNPTSTAVRFEQIKQLLEEVPRYVCVMIDEAYCEFNLADDPDATIELLAHYPNLVLLRTFSKIYGLCGLRVGYALCGSESFVDAVDRLRQPFFCNAVAQAAAVEALKHQDEVAGRVERAIAARLYFEEQLDRLGLSYAQSQANFCWIALGQERSEQTIIDGLAAEGVIVRSGKALGRDGYLRVTYGLPQENERFFAVLEGLL